MSPSGWAATTGSRIRSGWRDEPRLDLRRLLHAADRGPLSPSVRGGIATGAAAAAVPYPPGIAQVIVIGIAVVAGWFALAAARTFVAEVREGAAEVRRRRHLWADGRHVIAEVTSARFLNSWWMGMPWFFVEASFDDGSGARTERRMTNDGTTNGMTTR